MDKPIISFLIRCKFFFLFIGRKSNMWPAHNYLQIMVCSCIKETTLFSFLQPLSLAWKIVACVQPPLSWLLRFPRVFIKKQTRWLNDKATLLNLVIAKYCHLSLSHSSIIYLSLRLWQIIYWSAHHWQIRIFCLTSSNVNYFLIYPLVVIYPTWIALS